MVREIVRLPSPSCHWFLYQVILGEAYGTNTSQQICYQKAGKYRDDPYREQHNSQDINFDLVICAQVNAVYKRVHWYGAVFVVTFRARC